MNLNSQFEFGYDWPFILHVKHPYLHVPVLEDQKKSSEGSKGNLQVALKEIWLTFRCKDTGFLLWYWGNISIPLTS